MNHDLQLHTPWSDGFHNIAEQVDFAIALGLQAIAITDHLLPGSVLESAAERATYRADIRHAADASAADARGLLVLAGTEATALDARGGCSISAEIAGEFDWVLSDLSHHSKGTLADTPGSKSAYLANVFATYHAMCDAPFVDVISHPFNTGNTSPSLVPADYQREALEELACHMAATGTVFDLMNLMPFWFRKSGVDPVVITDSYAELVSLFAAADVWFQLSSDDHRSGLGNTRWSELVAAKAEIPERLFVAPGRRLPPLPAERL